jgi:hypothetical protein
MGAFDILKAMLFRKAWPFCLYIINHVIVRRNDEARSPL